ncbi:MAG: DUF3775 domain-containing protein [Hyphomicrobiales bacterium]|nr:DUF3775 domain-containing protein [Hyphomicrobiales bacterium]
MDIGTDKVAFIILRARELESKVGAWDAPGDEIDDVSETILEELPGDATRQDVASFITALNDDEKAELVALTWLGRGEYEVEEWKAALDAARGEQTTSTQRYLLGDPLLADYLEAGLEKLGISPSEVEDDAVRSNFDSPDI